MFDLEFYNKIRIYSKALLKDKKIIFAKTQQILLNKSKLNVIEDTIFLTDDDILFKAYLLNYYLYFDMFIHIKKFNNTYFDYKNSYDYKVNYKNTYYLL